MTKAEEKIYNLLKEDPRWHEISETANELDLSYWYVSRILRSWYWKKQILVKMLVAGRHGRKVVYRLLR